MVLRNPMSDESRRRLTQRRDDLRRSITDRNRGQMMADISAMLACYHTYAAMTKAEVSKIATNYVVNLNGIPTWAISRACYQIRTGAVSDISLDHPPSTIRVRVLAMSVAQPSIAEVIQIERLLAARKYVPPATPEQRAAVNTAFGKLVGDLVAKASVVDHVGPEGRERALNKLAASRDRLIEAMYREDGVEPRRSGGMLISPSLVRAVNHSS